MAKEEVVIDVKVKGDGSGKKTLGDLKKEVQAVQDSSKQLGKDLSDGLVTADKGAVSLKTQLRQMKDQLATLDQGSAEFMEMAQQAAILEDQIKDVDAQVRFLSSDTKNLDTLVQAGQGIAGGFQAASGAAALFGKDQKAVQEALQKVIAIQGILNGVQQVSNVLQRESILGSRLRIGQLVKWAKATKIATVTQKAFNWVLRANPIGLVITAIGLLIAGFVAFSGKIQDVGKFFVKLGGKVKELIDGFGKWKNVILLMLGPIGWLIKAWDFFFGEQAKHSAEELARLEAEKKARAEANKENAAQHKQRLNEIKERRKAEEKAFEAKQKEFDLEIDRMEAEGGNANALRIAKQEAVKKEIEDQLKAINEIRDSWVTYYEEQFRLSGKSKEQFLATLKGQGIDVVKLQEDFNSKVNELNQQLFHEETQLIKLKRAGQKEAIEEEVKDEEDKNAKLLALEEKQKQDLLKLRNDFLTEKEKVENNFLDSLLTQQQQEENAIREKYFNLILMAEEFGEDSALLVEAQETQLAEIRARFAEEERQAKIAQQKEIADNVINTAESTIKAIEAINSLANQKELNRIKAKQEAGERLSKAEEKRLIKEEKTKRAFAVAQIAIDTARAISSAVASGAAIPFPGNIPAIIAGVAAVLTNVASASKILGESLPSFGGGSSSDSVGNIQETQGAPQLNSVTEGSTLLNQPTKVVVLEQDISNAQSSVNVIEQEATF